MQKIIILYYSGSGKTRLLAKRIHEIFTSIAPQGLQISLMDATQMDFNALRQASGLIIGSPDYFSYPAGQIKIYFDQIYEFREENKSKPVFCFLTHGGSGKAGKFLLDLCNAVNFKVITSLLSVEKEISKKDELQIEKNCKSMLKILKLDAILQ
jgi:flavorubredoxin